MNHVLSNSMLSIRPWPDRVLDTLGHDPRSWYSETFWLPILGPTCIVVLRRFADGFERQPEGFSVPYAALSPSLGLGERDTNSAPLRRALKRLEQFGFVSGDGEGALLVRRHLPPVQRKHLKRLPEVVQSAHHEWAEAQLVRPANEVARARARRISLCLLEEGESPDCAERSLVRIGFSNTTARDAVAWAVARHLSAARAVEARGPAA